MKCQFDIALSFATENQPLVEDVYHYLKAKGFRVFFAPSLEGQAFISGKNQRQVFYQIFGWEAGYAALFVTKDYICKQVPMEEARIALIEREGTDTAIPIYVDGTPLPKDMLDPKQTNYFSSNNAIAIASHLAARCRRPEPSPPEAPVPQERGGGHTPPETPESQEFGGMHISGNTAEKQVFIQTFRGKLEL